MDSLPNTVTDTLSPEILKPAVVPAIIDSSPAPVIDETRHIKSTRHKTKIATVPSEPTIRHKPEKTPVITEISFKPMDNTRPHDPQIRVQESYSVDQQYIRGKRNKSSDITLTKEDMERYEKAFQLFDHDGQGYITCSELGRVMRSLGMEPTVDELHYMITAADIDGSGTVEFDEFVCMMKCFFESHSREEDEETLIRKVFQVFDKSSDGYISSQELKIVMSQLGENLTEEEVNAMLCCADTNGDGSVTFEGIRHEYKTMAQKYFE